jgi:uncharacterized cupin superfamily protein
MTTRAQSAIKQPITDAQLEPFPVPAEWVIEGNPEGRAAILWRSEDGKHANGIWECTPGTFSWTHTDETATLVTGRVTVTLPGGEAIELAAGDLAFFPEGMTTRWQIHETVRKSFHVHAKEGLPF